MRYLKPAFLLACAAIVTACAAPVEPAYYANEKPQLDLKRYFNGTLDAWGIFQDRSGKIVKRFTVVMKCSWDSDTGTLDEDFSYSDGTKQRRVWTLHQMPDGSLSGTAADVVGTAAGNIAGNALHWNYVLALPVDGKVYNVNMDDWMYLMDERVMLNRAKMSKFGISLGEVTLSFTKRP